MNRIAIRMLVMRGFVAVLLVVAVAPLATGGENSDPRPQIDVADLKRHCSFLAGDALEGRGAGTRGGQAAAAYLVSELKRMNLVPPPGLRDYRQPFGHQYSNVLGIIPGQHPEKKAEWIVVGAHYDHVGYGTAENSHGPIGRIHNGADDNASGTSVLLELASVLSDPAATLDRSVMIAFWDAEEVGLLGSKHWVSQPTVPLSQVKLAVNLDMIGRMRSDHVAVMGWRSAAGLRRAMVVANTDPPLRFGFGSAVTADSDHYSFYAARRPVIHFDTEKHEDYHRPSDDVEKVNFDGLERLGRFIARLVQAAANTPTLPEFRHDAGNEPALTRLDPKARLAPPVRLGIRWSPQRSDEDPSLEVADIIPNTPASKIGIRKGDRLLKFDRWTGGSLNSFREAISVAPSEVDMEWQSPGETETRTSRITLAGEGVRLGVTYRADPALPGCGVVTTVMSFTPAERVGLAPGDVLVSLNDAELPPFADLGKHLPVDSAPISLLVERNGQPRRVMIDLR